MRVAMDNSSYDLVARMDSDDVSVPERFELQLKAFAEDPESDIVGGYISEFVGEATNITGIRTVQLSDELIKEDMKKRCAMNHVSVMFRKKAVLDSGGYLDWYCNEDYYLWIRMIQNGCIFKNVPFVLVNVRTGSGMSARRGGWRYFRSEQKIQKLMYDSGAIGLPRYLYNVAVRFVGEYLVSGNIRQVLYRFIRRSPKKVNNYVLRTSCETKSFEPFSVIMSVYQNDNPLWVDQAMNSIVNQSVQPSEIVLVVDGPVPDKIKKVIEKYSAVCKN